VSAGKKDGDGFAWAIVLIICLATLVWAFKS
jgi:hypothetical protein